MMSEKSVRMNAKEFSTINLSAATYNFCLDREVGIFINDTLYPDKLIEAFKGPGSNKILSDK